LEAEHEVASAVFIPDDVLIADIDVQVSILKDGDDDLDLRLVGPDGTTAALYFTNRRKAWGGGRMFDDTLIDDEAPHSGSRLPSPPAHRSFRPQGMGDPQRSSLKVFYGKHAKGTWQLIVRNNARNRGRGAGLLNGWALLVKPASTDTASPIAPKHRDENRENSK
jgi:subtilisin-like proprotein convertase family protein